MSRGRWDRTERRVQAVVEHVQQFPDRKQWQIVKWIERTFAVSGHQARRILYIACERHGLDVPQDRKV